MPPIRKTKQGDFYVPTEDELTEQLESAKRKEFFGKYPNAEQFSSLIKFKRVARTKTVNVDYSALSLEQIKIAGIQ